MGYVGATHGERGGDRIVLESSGMIRQPDCQTCTTAALTITNYGVSQVPLYAAASSGCVYALDAPDRDYLGNIKTLIVVSSSENHVEINCGAAAFVIGGTTYGTVTFLTSGNRGGGVIQLYGASSGKWYPLNGLTFSSGNGSPRWVASSGL